MLTVVSSTCLLFAACALFYQADKKRSAVAELRASPQLRTGVRAGATLISALTLIMIASLQGWELGVPVWLGLFSFVFVAGLFLSAQKPDWHPKSAALAGGLGVISGAAALAF